jgi:hypothetical protein
MKHGSRRLLAGAEGTLASRGCRETSVALTSTLHWFETDVLTDDRNDQGLARLNTDPVQHEAIRPRTRRVILDIDSSESPVHGAQEQSAYHGDFESGCHHFSNRRGTVERPIKGGKAATHWTRLSCHRFRVNEVRLLLGVIATVLAGSGLKPSQEKFPSTVLGRIEPKLGELLKHTRPAQAGGPLMSDDACDLDYAEAELRLEWRRRVLEALGPKILGD